jgi:hypothetical protein
VCDVVDYRIGPGKYKAIVPIVGPAHKIRGRSVSSMHFDYFCVSVGLAQSMPLDDQPIACDCLHLVSPSY